ncbi:epimerase [Albidovulum aquaemixtae]|nr:epimerase [Defluviimonas aquaemixtae]
MPDKALILGASGHFGGQAARAFATAGWHVECYRRGTEMTGAATGAQVIVNGLNPPNYHAWDRLVPEITASVLAAAKASGATVCIPGNVYVFGTEPAPWDEDTPHRPVARKGRIRAEMEARYQEAAATGLRTIVLRGGDFIDPDQAGGLFDRFVIGKAAKGVITTFGDPGATHAWAFLPDMARAAAALAANRNELAAFEDVPFPGLSFSTEELARTVTELTGHAVRIRRFPWWIMNALSPFWELARELKEMRYLYDHPHALGGDKFRRLLPEFPITPLQEVLKRFSGQLDLDPDQAVA